MEFPGIQPIAMNKTLSDLDPAKRSNVSSIGEVSTTFGSMLTRALESVENGEKQVDRLNEQFITGQMTDVHTLMIASEKAQLGLQLTVQVRNKIIEAYQEVMRTQL